MNLYQITDTVTASPVPGAFFSDLKSAKARRRELNGTDYGDAPKQNIRYVVSPGPDNKHYKEKAK